MSDEDEPKTRQDKLVAAIEQAIRGLRNSDPDFEHCHFVSVWMESSMKREIGVCIPGGNSLTVIVTPMNVEVRR